MLEKFAQSKEMLLYQLKKLREDLTYMANEFELDLKEQLQKINNGIVQLEQEKFSIAFFGAFSDGKTSILSALIKRLDLKISPEPTTDKIVPYEFENYIFVDTPGLFSEKLMHDELTKKYISEANVIIYVVDPINPLKESHWAVIRWLFDDLKKENAVIFVVNKMDKICDLEDEEDFNENCLIKKEVVLDTLKQIIKIDKSNSLPEVVCISADPYEKGLAYWFKNWEEYEKLSRLKILREKIDNFVESARNELILKAGISIINDSVRTTVRQISCLKEEIQKKIIREMNVRKNEIENRLDEMEKKLRNSIKNITDQLINLREETLLSLSSAKDLKELRETILVKIGKEGEILVKKVNDIVNTNLSIYVEYEKGQIISFERSLEWYNETISSVLKVVSQLGLKWAEKILDSNKKELIKMVFELRKDLKLDKIIKFKSGGEAMKWASKWAKSLQKFAKFLKVLPVLTEALDFLMKMWNEKKFKEEKEKIMNEITELFKALLDLISEENFIEYTEIPSLRELYKNITNNLMKYESLVQKLDEISYKLNDKTKQIELIKI